MPNLNKNRRMKYLPKKTVRQPSGDQSFLHSTAWRQTRQIKLRLNPVCEVCGIDCTSKNPIDHIINRANGGALLGLDNLMTLCEYHHNKKSAMEQKGLFIEAIIKDGESIPAIGERERIKNLLR